MLRVRSEQGWWLITHPDHARLAAAFASHWGNSLFKQPSPRKEVLDAIGVHDDGWAVRDAHPAITRDGKPSAFSVELVGKYSAFEEIDLADYLAIREDAVTKVAYRSAYAALLVSMHTSNLLRERADRSTMTVEQQQQLDSFLFRESTRQQKLRSIVQFDQTMSSLDASDEAILTNFCLLQATDNLSLLSCVDFAKPATLLHPLPTVNGSLREVQVQPLETRTFQLAPYPLDEPLLRFDIPAKHIRRHVFKTANDLAELYAQAPVQALTVTIIA